MLHTNNVLHRRVNSLVSFPLAKKTTELNSQHPAFVKPPENIFMSLLCEEQRDCNCTSAGKISFLFVCFKASSLSLDLLFLLWFWSRAPQQRYKEIHFFFLDIIPTDVANWARDFTWIVVCATFREFFFRYCCIGIVTVKPTMDSSSEKKFSSKQIHSPSRAHESRDCTLTRQLDAPSSFVRRTPMWRRQSPHRRADSRMLMLCCSDNCSISDKSAECPPSCWCECCCCFPAIDREREEDISWVLDFTRRRKKSSKNLNIVQFSPSG